MTHYLPGGMPDISDKTRMGLRARRAAEDARDALYEQAIDAFLAGDTAKGLDLQRQGREIEIPDYV